jgi:dipeptidyl aminopeptidase/acylaminoacyl peptidase
VDLTPFEKTRAGIHQIVRTDPDNVLITHNKHDKTAYDLYRVNLKTREQTMLAQNPGDVLFWLTDDEGNLRARVRKKDEGHSIRNWQNRIIFYRKLEDFLAGHLGGRSAGFDLYEFAINSK